MEDLQHCKQIKAIINIVLQTTNNSKLFQKKLTTKKNVYGKQLGNYQGPVVQSMVSLTSSLRGQLVRCFMTSYPNILIFFAEKMREAFALQKLFTFFQPKILAYLRYESLKF